jgi:hypothetical protein
MVSPDVEFVDLAQGVTAKGRDELAFSDAGYQDHRMREADGLVVFRFIEAGTNDGAFGPFSATGKRVAFQSRTSWSSTATA